EGVAMLAGLLAWGVLVGLGKEALVDLIRGREIRDMPDRVVNATLGAVGLNRYTVDKGLSDGPFEYAMALMDPSLGWVTSAWKDAAGGIEDGSRSVRHLPAIGDLIYYRTPLGRGYYLNEQERNTNYRKDLRELRTQAADFRRSGDYARMMTTLRI